MTPKYKRILLKLSGEALAGDQRFGLNENVVSEVVDQLVEVHKMGVQIGLVIGGGAGRAPTWIAPLPITWACSPRS